jgi:hypothetical protein
MAQTSVGMGAVQEAGVSTTRPRRSVTDYRLENT